VGPTSLGPEAQSLALECCDILSHCSFLGNKAQALKGFLDKDLQDFHALTDPMAPCHQACGQYGGAVELARGLASVACAARHSGRCKRILECFLSTQLYTIVRATRDVRVLSFCTSHSQ